MTSREIAALTEKRHDNVVRTMDTLHSGGHISLPQIEEVPNPGAGPKMVAQYRVGKRDSYVIVAQLSPEFTARLVDRWQELESAAAPTIPTTLSGALRLAAEQAELIERQQAALVAAAPKIEFAEAVRNVNGLCTFEEIAKALGIGRNTMISQLKAAEILQANRMPYQRYIDRGYFEVIEQTPWTDSQGATHPCFSTRVTGAGQVWLAKRFAQPGTGSTHH